MKTATTALIIFQLVLIGFSAACIAGLAGTPPAYIVGIHAGCIAANMAGIYMNCRTLANYL